MPAMGPDASNKEMQQHFPSQPTPLTHATLHDEVIGATARYSPNWGWHFPVQPTPFAHATLRDEAIGATAKVLAKLGANAPG